MFRRTLETAVAAERNADDAPGAAAPGTAGPTAALAGGTDMSDAVDEVTGAEGSLGQREADALGRLAESALTGGLDRGTTGDPLSGGAARGRRDVGRR